MSTEYITINGAACGEGISLTIKAQYARCTYANAATDTGYKATFIMEREITEPKILSYTRDGKGKVVSRHTKDIANTVTASPFASTTKYVAEPQVLRMERTEEEKLRRHEEGEKGAKYSAAKEMRPRRDGLANTLTSSRKDNLLCEPQKAAPGQAQRICDTLHGGSKAVIAKDGTIYGVNSRDPHGGTISEMQIQFENNPARTVTTAPEPECHGESTLWRIRKLTPRECFRLMDVDDADIDKIQAAGIPKTQQYKLAGNSIVVAVLYHIFRKMFIDTADENQQLSLF